MTQNASLSGEYPGVNPERVSPSETPNEIPDVTDDPSSGNIARPPGDWSVAPDPVEPNKEGQQLEDPRDKPGSDEEWV